MRFRTQAVAYPYFVVALLLYGLQVAFGLFPRPNTSALTRSKSGCPSTCPRRFIRTS